MDFKQVEKIFKGDDVSLESELLKILKFEGTITDISGSDNYLCVIYSHMVSDFSTSTHELWNVYGLYINGVKYDMEEKVVRVWFRHKSYLNRSDD